MSIEGIVVTHQGHLPSPSRAVEAAGSAVLRNVAVRRLALVTGASSGIGEAYAERLARDGWDLIVVARRRDRLEELAARLAANHETEVEISEADLASDTGVESVAGIAAEAPLDLLVNNAALAHYMPFLELPPGSAHELVELNVLAPVLLSRAVLPGMVERGRGAIINVASLLAFSGGWQAPQLPQRAVYASTKSFLLTFTQILAAELADTGVRVQVLCPGVVRTEFHSRQGFDMSGRTRMEPQDVVAASIADLERGVVVSIPGLAEEAVLEAVLAAQDQLAGFTGAASLPARYRPQSSS
jgi:short-subunit dehydrogenase